MAEMSYGEIYASYANNNGETVCDVIIDPIGFQRYWEGPRDPSVKPSGTQTVTPQEYLDFFSHEQG